MDSFTLTYSPNLRLPSFASSEVCVLGFDLVASAAHLDSLRSTLSSDEVARAEAFHFPHHAERFITTRGILRNLLSQLVGIAPHEVVFTYGDAGKPSVKVTSLPDVTHAPGASRAKERRAEREDLPLHFNVSHSEDQCLFAFSREIEIGVDIESKRRDLSKIDSLAGVCLSDEDHKRFLSLQATEKPEAFFRFWTRKEALLKAIGVGLGHPLKDFDVSYLVNEPARLVRSDNVFGDAEAWSLRDIIVSSDYEAAIAFRSQNHRVRQLGRDDLRAS